MNIGFDNQKYLQMQSAHIRERISMFGDKLYLEFGGKLFDDYHAARVLPGFEPDSKLKMLLQLKDQAEIVIAISASALETNKTRRDLGLTYDLEVLRLQKHSAISVFTSEALSSHSMPVSPLRTCSAKSSKPSASVAISTILLKVIRPTWKKSSAKKATAKTIISKPAVRSLS